MGGALPERLKASSSNGAGTAVHACITSSSYKQPGGRDGLDFSVRVLGDFGQRQQMRPPGGQLRLRLRADACPSVTG